MYMSSPGPEHMVLSLGPRFHLDVNMDRDLKVLRGCIYMYKLELHVHIALNLSALLTTWCNRQVSVAGKRQVQDVLQLCFML